VYLSAPQNSCQPRVFPNTCVGVFEWVVLRGRDPTAVALPAPVPFDRQRPAVNRPRSLNQASSTWLERQRTRQPPG